MSAIVAQHVADAEMNCDLPCGKPLLVYSNTGKHLVGTNQLPSASCVSSRNRTP